MDSRLKILGLTCFAALVACDTQSGDDGGDVGGPSDTTAETTAASDEGGTDDATSEDGATDGTTAEDSATDAATDEGPGDASTDDGPDDEPVPCTDTSFECDFTCGDDFNPYCSDGFWTCDEPGSCGPVDGIECVEGDEMNCVDNCEDRMVVGQAYCWVSGAWACDEGIVEAECDERA